MKKNKDLVIIILCIVGVLLITTLLILALLRTPGAQNEEIIPEDTDSTQMTPSDSENISTPSDETPAFADSHNILDECIAFKKANTEATGGNFEEGKVLVTFQSGVKYSEATDLIEEYDLQVVSSTEARESFNSGRWFAIEVPKGEEYEWMCVLESSDLVVRAVREPIFDLHQ